MPLDNDRDLVRSLERAPRPATAPAPATGSDRDLAVKALLRSPFAELDALVLIEFAEAVLKILRVKRTNADAL